MYYEEQLIKYKNDTKMILKTLHEILNKQKKNKALPNKFVGTNTTDIIDNPSKITNKFNEYLKNIGPQLSKNINKNTDKTFDQYLTDTYKNSTVS